MTFICRNVKWMTALSAFAFVCLAPGLLRAANPTATLGTYYFEGWYHDSPERVAAFATAELRNSFPDREPIWGQGLWRGDTVDVMEQQIDLAADHGITFFSFDWYWYGNPTVTANDGINAGLRNFMQATNRDRMKFNINIVDAGPTTIDSDAEWRQVADMLLPYLTDSQYLRVGGNPLVTNFNAAGMTQANYNYFQQIASAAGLAEVEFAANVAGSTSLYQYVTRYNAVPGWGAGEVEYPYQSLTDYVEGNDSWAAGIWNTESGSPQSYIPVVMAGWDARPWNTPPSWYFNPSRTPAAVAAHLQKAIDWIDENPTLATPERLVMIYAWNEFGEGGYIAPTLGDPHGLYLDAIHSVVGSNSVEPEPEFQVTMNGHRFELYDGVLDRVVQSTGQKTTSPISWNDIESMVARPQAGEDGWGRLHLSGNGMIFAVHPQDWSVTILGDIAISASGRRSWQSPSTWTPARIPGPEWVATLSNDISASAVTLWVDGDAAADSINLQGGLGPLVIEIDSEATLSVTNGMTVGTAASLVGTGTIIGDVINVAGTVAIGVPEPNSLVLFLLGVSGLSCLRRRCGGGVARLATNATARER